MNAFFSGANWVFDLVLNFSFNLFILFIVLLIASIVVRARMLTFIFILLLGISFGSLWLASLNHVSVDRDRNPEATRLKVLSFDVQETNQNRRGVIDYLWDTDPDIICLQETSLEWRDALSELVSIYPHVKLSPDGTTTLMSKMQLKSLPVRLDTARKRVVVATAETELGAVDIYCVRLFDAARANRLYMRNREMGYLARAILGSPNQVLVMGNFNASSYSPSMFRFLRQTRLRTVSQSFPPQNTWPSGFSFIGSRLDHILTAAPAEVVDFRIGPYLGSSRLPIHLDVVFPPRAIDTPPYPIGKPMSEDTLSPDL